MSKDKLEQCPGCDVEPEVQFRKCDESIYHGYEYQAGCENVECDFYLFTLWYTDRGKCARRWNESVAMITTPKPDPMVIGYDAAISCSYTDLDVKLKGSTTERLNSGKPNNDDIIDKLKALHWSIADTEELIGVWEDKLSAGEKSRDMDIDEMIKLVGKLDG